MAKFMIHIKVDTLASGKFVDAVQPRFIQQNLSFPKRLKKMAEARMKEWVLGRTRRGVDVNNKPFTPLQDGSPSRLDRTGRMLAGIDGWSNLGIKPPKKGNLRSTAIAFVAVACDVVIDGEYQVYPYVVNYGKNAGNSVKEQIRQQQRRIERASYWLQQGVIEHTKTWLIKRATERLADAQKKLSELMQRDPGKVYPPREWFGLTEREWDGLNNALQAWVMAVVDALIAGIIDPKQLKQIQKESNKAFEAAIRAA